MNPQNQAPLRDLSGNGMLVNFDWSFHTVAPPDFPANPFPEYAIYWSGSGRVGVIDTINQQGKADKFTGAIPANDPVPLNVLPPKTDTIANSQYIPGFDPTEIAVDARTNGATCHSFIYAMSASSGEIVIINTRTTLPIAILKTPSPGGIAIQSGGGQSANVLCVTNSSANTLTTFGIGSFTPGLNYLNGPVYVQKVTTTGNTPRAISITISPTGQWSRDPGLGGPSTPMLMYVDLTDGVVNTKSLSADAPARRFTLGADSSPNDVSFTPCYVPCLGCPVIMYAAISQGGHGPLEGKISFYVAGPGCTTGSTTPIRPDALIGSTGGFDSPAGLDEVFSLGTFAFFAVCESGSQANALTTVQTIVGNPNLPLGPELKDRFKSVGANPTNCAHRAAYADPLIGLAGSGTCYAPPPPAGCVYKGTEQCIVALDGSLGVSFDLYVCARGSGLVQVVNMSSGARAVYSPVIIPSVRFVASHATQ
jgi:hypothetical protein